MTTKTMESEPYLSNLEQVDKETFLAYPFEPYEAFEFVDWYREKYDPMDPKKPAPEKALRIWRLEQYNKFPF